MKLLHVASALALGFTPVVAAPLTLAAAPVQTEAADVPVVSTLPPINAVSLYDGNIGAAQRAVADWTHVTPLPDTSTAATVAGKETEIDRYTAAKLAISESALPQMGDAA